MTAVLKCLGLINSVKSMKKQSFQRLKPVALNCCPECAGRGRIWDFEDPDDPVFFYCELCRGKRTLNN